MTKDAAFGGKASQAMTREMASKKMQEHWHSPEEALELGYTGDLPDLPQPAGQRHQNHPSQQCPPGMSRPADPALPPAHAIEDVPGRVEQSALAAVVGELKAEVDNLKAEVEHLKAEIEQLKTRGEEFDRG